MRIGFPGLGIRLRKARMAAGLTQEAAATIGVSWMTLHRWERLNMTVRDQKLRRLADLYSIALYWFLTAEPGQHGPMDGQRIGLPGLGARLRGARVQTALTPEAVAESMGVSWMTIHRWEHDQRAIYEERLERVSLLYGKTFRWFLTPDGAELDPPDPRHEVARRIYHRVAQAPRKSHTMLERVVGDVLEVLESAPEPVGNNDG